MREPVNEKTPAATGAALGLLAGKDFMHLNSTPAAPARNLLDAIHDALAARRTCTGLLPRLCDLVGSYDPMAWEMAEVEAQELLNAIQHGRAALREVQG